MRILGQGGEFFINLEKYSEITVFPTDGEKYTVRAVIDNAAGSIRNSLLGTYDSIDRAKDIVNQIASWKYNTFIMPEK